MRKDIRIFGTDYTDVVGIKAKDTNGTTVKFELGGNGNATVYQNEDGFIVIDPAETGGGGGLEYEEGTFTPSEDVAKPTIYFSNTHTSRPFSITIADVGATTPDTSSAVVWNFVSYYDVFGSPYNIDSNLYYAIIPYRYKTSSSDTASTFRINTLSNTGTNVCFQYWVSESAFYPEGNNSTYRSGRTYKWIAVWAPTT